MTGTRKKLRALFLAALMVGSVFAGTIAFAGSAAAVNGTIDLTQDNDPDDSPQDTYDTTLTSSGGPYWQGQRLAIEATDEPANAVLQLREADNTDDGQEVGSFVSDLTLDSNREAVIDTSNREGDYVVTRSGGAAGSVFGFTNGIADGGVFTNGDTDGTLDTTAEDAGGASGTAVDAGVEQGSFEVTVQSLSANFKDNEIEQEEEFLELDSNRGSYTVVVSSDDLDQGELADAFAAEVDQFGSDPTGTNGGRTDSAFTSDDGSISNSPGTNNGQFQDPRLDDENIRLNVASEDANISVNFSDVDTGDYTLDFEVADTDASASDSVSVTEEEDVEATLTNTVVRAGEGDVASIPIELENTDTATVNVGYNDVNYNLTFDIEDGNDDGVVTPKVNLYTTGRPDLQLVADDPSNPGAGTTNTDGDTGAAHTYSEIQTALGGSISGPYKSVVDTANNGNTVRDFDGDGTYGELDDQIIAYNVVNAIKATQQSVTVDDDDDDISNVNLTAYGDGDRQIDDPPLDNTEYDINVTNGGVRGTELAVGTLSVTPTRVDGLRSWTMSETNFEDLDSDDADAVPEIYEAVDNGELTQDTTIAENDVMVFQYRGTGVFGALENQKDSSEDYEEAFVEMMRGSVAGYGSLESNVLVGDFDFQVEQTNPVANRDEKNLDLTETWSDGGLRVVPDEDNSTMFVFVTEREADVDRSVAEDRTVLPYVGGSASQSDLAMTDGEQYEANLSVRDDTLNNDGVLDATREFEIVDKSLTFDTDAGDVIRVRAEAGQTISGSTSVAPGTELNLRVKSTGASPFLRSPEPTVQPDGTFNASVDFSTIAENTSFEATARGFDDEDTPGVVGQATAASISISDQNSTGDSVTVDSVTMSDGGYVVIHRVADDGSAGEVIGNTEYLEPGTETDLAVQLDSALESSQDVIAMAHLDTNGNEQYDFPNADGPYTANGSAVIDSASITVSAQTPTETATPMPDTATPEPDTATPEPDTATPEPDTDTATETTTTTGPGFTAALALVALAAAALIAARRRD